MTEKAKQDTPKFVVKKREKKVQPDYFKNVTPFRHPVSDLLEHSNAPEILDTQGEIFGHSENSILDTQKTVTDTPKTEKIRHSEKLPLDTQIIFSEQPNKIDLSANAPKTVNEAPKKDKVLSAKTLKVKNLDTQKKYDYKQYDAKRSTVRINLHLDKGLDQRVREYCVKANPRLELKEFFELAALQFLGTQKESGLSANAPLDDLKLMIYKTKPSIINLYLKISGNSKWKINDDAKASAYNEIDLQIIELGMLQTLGNKTTNAKINSFAYFIPEIDQWIQTNPSGEILSEMVKHYRRRLGISDEK